MALRWVFTADTGPFRKGLDQMRTESKAFSKTLSSNFKRAFAFLSGAGLAVAISNSVRRINELDRASRRLGVSIQFLQGLELAAKNTGVELDNMIEFLQDINERSLDAANGSGEAAEAFNMLKVNAKEFSALNMQQQWNAITDAVANATDKQEALAAVMKIGSDEAARLFPQLQKGSDGFARMTERMVTFGNVGLNTMRALQEEMDKLGLSAENFLANTVTTGGAGILATGQGSILALGHLVSKITGQSSGFNSTGEAFLSRFQALEDRSAELKNERIDAEAARKRARLAKEIQFVGPPVEAGGANDPTIPFIGPPIDATSQDNPAFDPNIPFIGPPSEAAGSPAANSGSAPSIPVTSLQSIGGSTAGGGGSPAREGLRLASIQVGLLHKIAENTSKGEDGTTKTAEPKVP